MYLLTSTGATIILSLDDMSIAVSQELKGLESRLKKNKAEHETISAEIDALISKRKECEKEYRDIEWRIKELKNKNKDTIVSEHAMLRFLERVEGFDLEKIKENVLPEITRDLMAKMMNANGKYPAGTHNVVVRDNTVVTIEE